MKRRKRCVFKTVLKPVKLLTVRTNRGRLFQVRGAATEKRRLPSTVLCRGMCNSSATDERKLRCGMCCCIDEDRYGGCCCLKALKQSTAILYSIRHRTGSQCSSANRSREDRWRRPALQTMRAARFWTRCSLSRFSPLTPVSSELQ